jgi:preprotein translocase subunit SecA
VPAAAAAGAAGAAEAAGGDADAQPAADAPAQQPVVKSEWDKTPRNAPCPCGSGKKFKQCHGLA